MPTRHFGILGLLLCLPANPLAAEPIPVQVGGDGSVEEVEQIRKQLGPEFSIESKEFEIEFENRDHGHRSSSAFSPGHPSPDKTTQMNERLRAMSQATRDQARQLEQMAAEAEMKMQYELADRLRDVARRQWESARFMRAPLEYPAHPEPGFVPPSFPMPAIHHAEAGHPMPHPAEHPPHQDTPPEIDSHWNAGPPRPHGSQERPAAMRAPASTRNPDR
ncbi:hypothetical protein [Bremerella cremea]|uniref:hypothetical protein n=1 Tax=Bremerella cremea TaxID=1031537 RepID=UPI0031EED5C5